MAGVVSMLDQKTWKKGNRNPKINKNKALIQKKLTIKGDMAFLQIQHQQLKLSPIF